MGATEAVHRGGIGVARIFSGGALIFLKKVDKSWRPFLGIKTQATNPADCFTVEIKRSDMVTFSFSVHAITEAKQ